MIMLMPMEITSNNGPVKSISGGGVYSPSDKEAKQASFRQFIDDVKIIATRSRICCMS
jgi:hypothetical protein